MIITELIKSMPEYSICKISEEHIDDVMALMKSNEYFYSVTQKHDVCREDCIADLTAVPPGIDLSKKTYVALYKDETCIAVLDFIEGFPRENIGYLGLFMLHKEVQGKGIGKVILSKLVEVSMEKGFEIIELACYETNKKGLAFGQGWVFVKCVDLKEKWMARYIRLFQCKKSKIIIMGITIACN